jgi:hypothetical protein
MSVDTRAIAGRREVYYNSLEDLRADVEDLAAGEIVSLGNWSPGQAFMHLARAMELSIDGFDARVPWFLRLGARLIRNRLIKGPMRAGFKLPQQAETVLVPGTTSTEEGLAAIRAAIDRLERESPRAVHPLLGALTPEQWIRLHLTHAALHMSFLRAAGG